MSTAPATRMTRKRLETREKLLSATLKLVIKKGVTKTTMDDITELADLGRRTLYYHFSSKEECIVAAVAKVYIKHAQRLDEKSNQQTDIALDIGIKITTIIHCLVNEKVTKRLVEHPRLMMLAITTAFSQFGEQDVNLGINSGRFEQTIKRPQLNSIIKWSLVGLIVDYSASADDIDLAAGEFVTMYLMLFGLSSADAKAIAEQAKGQ